MEIKLIKSLVCLHDKPVHGATVKFLFQNCFSAKKLSTYLCDDRPFYKPDWHLDAHVSKQSHVASKDWGI